MLLRTNAGKPAAKNPPISVFRQNLVLSDGEEYEEQLDDGEEYEEELEADDDEQFTEEEWGSIIEELLIEAALDERIPVSALGINANKLTQVALSLGLAINTEDCGLVLSRDIPLMQQVEELTLSSDAYAAKFKRAFQNGNAEASESMRKTAKRGLAKGVGRAKTAFRQAGGASGIARTGGRMVKAFAKRNPLATAVAGGVAGAVGGNLLTRNAESRNKKS